MSTECIAMIDWRGGVLKPLIAEVKALLVKEGTLSAEQAEAVPSILLEAVAATVAKNLLSMTHAVVIEGNPTAKHVIAVAMREVRFDPEEALSIARRGDAINKQIQSGSKSSH